MRARRNLFQEALEAGHLVIEHGKPYLVGSVGFEAALLDLTSARAREWALQASLLGLMSCAKRMLRLR